MRATSSTPPYRRLRHLALVGTALCFGALATAAQAAPTANQAATMPGDFWASWGDGRAELNGYQLQIPRYGQPREGSLVLIYVTEQLSDSLRVKADPGKHPPSDVYSVLKLNAVRKFQTGIYDYSVMTSVFSRTDFGEHERPFPWRKVSMSSQEWCGHVFHQLLAPGAASPLISSHSHSYFDGEADDLRNLDAKPGSILEDELPLLLRSYAQKRDLLAAGARLTVPFLPSLVRARLLHQPLAWTQATIERLPGTLPIKTSAGEFQVWTYNVQVQGGDHASFHIESVPPYRLIHYRWDAGEEATLRGSARLHYWQQNSNGNEDLLKKLGLSGPAASPKPMPTTTPTPTTGQRATKP